MTSWQRLLCPWFCKDKKSNKKQKRTLEKTHHFSLYKPNNFKSAIKLNLSAIKKKNNLLKLQHLC